MARGSIKHSDSPSKPSTPAWMVTYGDMMTLLLVFFVLIVSFSTIEIAKFKAAMGSFRGALMPWKPASSGPIIITKVPVSISDYSQFQAATEMQALVEEADLAEMIEVHDVTGGIRIIFSDPVLFEEGKDDLKPLALPILRKVVEMALKTKAEDIMVEGHTDDTPINTEKFPSNWELSAGRALKVLRFFQSEKYPPEKLVAVGYGEYRPRVKMSKTASVKEKAVNRRVEIFLRIQPDKVHSNVSPLSPYGTDGGWGD
ncbi:OmpA family protein [bacterium]|nr:OmpA family protein [bacterium]